MKFLDEAKIYLKAGDGGDGCLSFRHAKFIEFGGPDGGAGGAGGSIYVTAVDNVNTLIDYRYKQHFKAKKGGNGAGKSKAGRAADDIILKVPVGTQILDEDKITEIADLAMPQQTVLLAKGGKGGLGNVFFKTSTNQAPRKTQKGAKGEEKWVWFKLKLIADVGLVGMPNAGKSTFISAVTNAKAKIRDYPFSTLTPQLGMLRIDNQEIIIADIPGLMLGANEGRGLGWKFLAHIERCSVLVHIIDISSQNPIKNYLIIREELSAYGSSLRDKPEIVILNKVDLISNEVAEKIKSKLEKITKTKIFTIAANKNQGCQEVTAWIAKFIIKNDLW
jgi:GTP-binding protein